VKEAQTDLLKAGLALQIETAVTDKGYHATHTSELADSLNLRTCIPEPNRRGNGMCNWEGVPEEKRRAVFNNRCRMRGARSTRLQLLQNERVERGFAHICDRESQHS